MDRKRLEKKFLDYFEAKLPPEEMEQFAAALEDDAELQDQFAAYQDVIAAERDLAKERPQLSANFDVKVMNAIEEVQTGFLKRFRSSFQAQQRYVLTSLATVAVVAIVIKVGLQTPLRELDASKAVQLIESEAAPKGLLPQSERVPRSQYEDAIAPSPLKHRRQNDLDHLNRNADLVPQAVEKDEAAEMLEQKAAPSKQQTESEGRTAGITSNGFTAPQERSPGIGSSSAKLKKDSRSAARMLGINQGRLDYAESDNEQTPALRMKRPPSGSKAERLSSKEMMGEAASERAGGSEPILRGKTASALQRLPARPGYAILFVPKRMIPAGARLTPDNIRQVYWPQTNIPSGAVLEFSELENRALKSGLEAGVPICSRHLK